MKQLRKNDGYVLPYVLAVFLALSFVAVTICSISLNNLRQQEASVSQTRALYEAEGLVEQAVAKLQTLTAVSDGSNVDQNVVRDAAAVKLWEQAEALDSVEILSGYDAAAVTKDLEIITSGGEGSVTVTAQVRVNLDLNADQAIGEGELAMYRGDASVSSIEYISYHISRSAGEEVPE